MAARASCFNPMERMTAGLGPMNRIRRFADLGKIRILAEEAIAGMNGIYIGDFRRADDRRDIQIAACAFGRTDADGFVRKPNV